jgi:hypothetical protein
VSPETLTLLRNILVSQQLNVGADDFLATAQAAAKALAELDAALKED